MTDPAKPADPLNVLGESLRPLLTCAMGSSIEVFDTRGPAGAGPPPHRHPWDEVYFVLEGELEVTVDGRARKVSQGEVAHAPGGSTHGYRNLTDDCHFLTIVSKGEANEFFEDVAANVEMSPPDLPGVVRVAQAHGIEFEL